MIFLLFNYLATVAVVAKTFIWRHEK